MELEHLHSHFRKTCFLCCGKQPVAVEEKPVLRGEKADNDASCADVIYEALEFSLWGDRKTGGKRTVNPDSVDWEGRHWISIPQGRNPGLDP